MIISPVIKLRLNIMKTCLRRLPARRYKHSHRLAPDGLAHGGTEAVLAGEQRQARQLGRGPGHRNNV